MTFEDIVEALKSGKKVFVKNLYSAGEVVGYTYPEKLEVEAWGEYHVVTYSSQLTFNVE